MKCPCNPNCKNRSSTCHSECAEYLEYEKEKHKEYNSKADYFYREKTKRRFIDWLKFTHKI